MWETGVKQYNPEQYGWKWEDSAKKMVPIWYTGQQLSPNLQKKKSKAKVQVADTVADDEFSDTDLQEPKRKRRRCLKKDTKATKDTKVGKNVDNARLNKDISVINDMDEEVADCEDIFSAEDVEEDFDGIIPDASEWEVSDFSSSEDSHDEWEQ